jgi:glutamate synthase (NADPH/NADH) small chain
MAEKISNKERMKIPRQIMPEQDPLIRRKNFKEVNLGFTEELAKMEALRCIQCPKPSCIEGCPVGVKINEFIALVAEGDYLGASAKMKEDNLLPAICGRVCPQEEQCEVKCTVGKKNDSSTKTKYRKESCDCWKRSCRSKLCRRFDSNGTRCYRL